MKENEGFDYLICQQLSSSAPSEVIVLAIEDDIELGNCRIAQGNSFTAQENYERILKKLPTYDCFSKDDTLRKLALKVNGLLAQLFERVHGPSEANAYKQVAELSSSKAFIPLLSVIDKPALVLRILEKIKEQLPEILQVQKSGLLIDIFQDEVLFKLVVSMTVGQEAPKARQSPLEAAKDKLAQEFVGDRIDLRLKEIYVEPLGGERAKVLEDAQFLLIDRALKLITETQTRSLLILGDSGMGKTCLLLRLCRQRWEIHRSVGNQTTAMPLALYIHLPQYKENLQQGLLEQVLKEASFATKVLISFPCARAS